ncbi:MAG: hypothetical protein K8F52_09535 [Candidatus Scalindua rubra]|nr:hypothetical protein [Candidatus Scalindua rubra]
MSNNTTCMHVQVIPLKRASSLNLIQYAILKVYILPHGHSCKFRKLCVISGMFIQSDDIVSNNWVRSIYIPIPPFLSLSLCIHIEMIDRDYLHTPQCKKNATWQPHLP